MESAKRLLNRIMNYPHREKECVYLCGPHLEHCVLVRGHEQDCRCRRCGPESPFQKAAKKYREILK